MEPRDHLTVGVDLASKALRSIYPPGHCGPNHYTTPPNPQHDIGGTVFPIPPAAPDISSAFHIRLTYCSLWRRRGHN